MKKKETTEEMEKRDAAGYARIPSDAIEFDEWEGEPVWLDEESPQSRRTAPQS